MATGASLASFSYLPTSAVDPPRATYETESVARSEKSASHSLLELASASSPATYVPATTPGSRGQPMPAPTPSSIPTFAGLSGVGAAQRPSTAPHTALGPGSLSGSIVDDTPYSAQPPFSLAAGQNFTPLRATPPQPVTGAVHHHPGAPMTFQHQSHHPQVPPVYATAPPGTLMGHPHLPSGATPQHQYFPPSAPPAGPPHPVAMQGMAVPMGTAHAYAPPLPAAPSLPYTTTGVLPPAQQYPTSLTPVQPPHPQVGNSTPGYVPARDVTLAQAQQLRRVPPPPSKGEEHVRVRNVYVAGLPLQLSEEQFANLMSAYGAVVSARLFGDKERTDGTGRAYGFALFETPEGAERAVASMSGMVLQGNRVQARLSKNGVVRKPRTSDPASLTPPPTVSLAPPACPAPLLPPSGAGLLAAVKDSQDAAGCAKRSAPMPPQPIGASSSEATATQH